MNDQAHGGAVEVVDGRFYIEGNEVSEDAARAAGWTPEAEASADGQSGAETAVEHTQGENAPGSVMGRLRAGYAAGQGDRRKVLEIAPARYHDLAAEFKPVDWDLRRKLIRVANRRGETGHVADLSINAQLMADSCVTMLFRPAAGEDYKPLHGLIEKFKGGEPIRFDSRLAEVLGIELIGGEHGGDIVRLVFGDAGIFEAHYMMLNGWSLQAFGEDDEDEADEGGERPT